MQFFDTHIHLSDFKDGAESVALKAFACGIDKMINMSSTPEDWQKVLELSLKYPNNIVPAVGIHPWYVSQIKANDFNELENTIKEKPHTVLGECGLDALKPDFAKQVDVFVAQIEMAKKYNRPIIIHNVKASNWFQENWKILPEKFVFHSYNGKIEFLKQILDHGGYVGFNASVFRISAAEKVIKYVPADSILLETDAPYQGFEKGKENSPAALPEIFEKFAQFRVDDKEKLSAQIYQNSLDFIRY